MMVDALFHNAIYTDDEPGMGRSRTVSIHKFDGIVGRIFFVDRLYFHRYGIYVP